jgi:hypothetical protein
LEIVEEAFLDVILHQKDEPSKEFFEEIVNPLIEGS